MKKNTLGLALAAAATLVAGIAVPAHATPATVVVAPLGQLARSTQSVSVTVSNVPAGQGVYVMYCATPAAGTRPSACFGRGVWASSDSKMTAQGAVPLDSAITLPVALQFTPQGGTAVDCEKAGCGVFVRRDHLGSTDLSLDSFTPIAFAPLVAPKVQAVPEAGRVLFTVEGYNGKTVNINFGDRMVTRAITSDSVKFYLGNGKQKAASVSVSADQAEIFTAKLKLKK
jgi:hypothetical protein